MTISAERPLKIAPEDALSHAHPHRTSWTERPGWLSQHLGTAIIGGILGYVFGHWLGNYITGADRKSVV